MATHSRILAWRIPWTEEPGELHTIHGVAKSWMQLSMQACYTIPDQENSSSFSLLLLIDIFSPVFGRPLQTMWSHSVLCEVSHVSPDFRR